MACYSCKLSKEEFNWSETVCQNTKFEATFTHHGKSYIKSSLEPSEDIWMLFMVIIVKYFHVNQRLAYLCYATGSPSSVYDL